MKGHILKAEMVGDVTTVTKQTKYGTFTCSVKVHEEDRDIANLYDGCYFAEMKCDIEAYRVKAQRMKERAISASHIYHVMTSSCDISDPCMIKLWNQVCVAWNLYEEANSTYEILRDSYSALVEVSLSGRRRVREQISKKRSLS